MKYKFKPFCGLVLLLIVMLLVGCTNSALPSENKKEDESIHLTLCNIGSIDESTVNRIGRHLEKLLSEKLGQPIDLELMTISRSNYNDQLNLMFLRNEAPDIFAIYQQSSFNDLVGSEQLLPLEEYLSLYFPAGNAIPDALWNRTTYDGVLYGIPQYYKEGQYVCYILRNDQIEEFQVDTSKIWTWDELHDLLLTIKAKYPDTYPILPHYGSVIDYLGQDSLGDNLGVLVDESSSSTTVENWYASDAYYNFCKQMHQWYQEGLVLPDAYDTQTNIYALADSGLGQGGLFRLCIKQVQILANDFSELRLSQYTADMWMDYITWGISSHCKNPELAVQVLNCLYSDPDVAMLMSCGEEGVDYLLDDLQNISFISPQSSHSFWSGNSWTWPGIDSLLGHINNIDTCWEDIDPNDVIYSPAYGFAYDPSSVQLEIEQCKSVVDKYHKGLVCGFLDPDEVLPQFIKELETAGINTIIAEKQRQLNLWLDTQQ